MKWLFLIVATWLAVSAVGDAWADDIAALKAKFAAPTEIPHPAYNPYSAAKAKLGKTLFFDPRLSGSNAFSCATCHNPEFGWEDAQARSVGEIGTALKRHTPTILNLAWEKTFGWDGRIPTLEGFVIGPITNIHEMNQDLDTLVDELMAVPPYRKMFAKAFPNRKPTTDMISMAIATFERTVFVQSSPFQRWIDGDERAISDAAKAGFVLFNGKAGCAQCHSGWRMADGKFHDVGIASPDLGRGGLEDQDEKTRHTFKTPTLRGVAQRAPYMHDGSLATLEDVIMHYNDKFIRRPTLAKEIKPLSLSGHEELNLLAFLRILTGDENTLSLPVTPH